MKKKSTIKLQEAAKRTYQKPTLKKLGSVSTLTLKTGSISDFGSSQFQP
ncbi:lasso RiPP family leader peptide-containing protein [Arcticibacterium luteifluviistationis]|uniref:RiPP n=1 Tax=Arcticibacterium luteifluviistationis TaxID=1784714 RepID=A0A2Z4G9J1_9BACT|nr:lasso RiPP family leader peptide-containing protein [Arcticibacterium luteifluviistationis]AWV97593.1 hypothetical protein DJ013_05195 [Arcticibacterium luteifluviistationis]